MRSRIRFIRMLGDSRLGHAYAVGAISMSLPLTRKVSTCTTHKPNIAHHYPEARLTVYWMSLKIPEKLSTLSSTPSGVEGRFLNTSWTDLRYYVRTSDPEYTL